ncbi:MAG: MqnA/MqnD/SBP family protein [Phycisphaerales bacterium]
MLQAVDLRPRDTALTAQQTLTVAYTPDSDDVFNFYAWEHGRLGLGLPGMRVEFHRDHINALNKSASRREYDVVAVSSVVYPSLARDYDVLAAGNSIGRGYGPVLVSDRFDSVGQLVGKRVGVAGLLTTGGCLAMMYCPGARFIECVYDQIADRVLAGELDAGVMIHEELLHYPAKGLHKISDLGLDWCEDTGLPLPVGLNLVKRSLPRLLKQDIADTCTRSLRWAHENFDEAFAFASRFGRGCAASHVAMFSNEDTVCLPHDARKAMRVMYDRLAGMGVAPSVPKLEIIDA